MGASQSRDTAWHFAPPTFDPDPPRPEQVTALRCRIDGPPARKALLCYRRRGEPSDHPVPLVRSGDDYIGLLQPFRSGERVSYHLEVWGGDRQAARWPLEGEAPLRVGQVALTPRRLAKTAVRLGSYLEVVGFALLLGLLLLFPKWEWARPFGFPLGESKLVSPLGAFDPPGLAVALLAVGSACAWLVCGRARPRVGPPGVILPLGALASLVALGSIRAFEPGLALEQARALTAALALYLLVRNSPRLQSLVPWLLAVVVGAQATVAIGQFVAQASLGLASLGEPVIRDLQRPGIAVLLDHEGRRWLRGYGLTVHPNILGGLLSAGLLVGLGLGLALSGRSGGVGRIFAAVLLIVAATGSAALALSFSRGAWIGLAAGLCACWLAALRQSWPPELRKRLALASLLISVVFALALVPARDLLVSRLNPGANPLEGRSLAERAIDWQVAPRLIADRPLLGVGAGSYARAAQTWYPEHVAAAPPQPAHNLFLLVAAEAGLLGGLAWLVLSLQPLTTLCRRRAPACPHAATLAAALLALFMAGLFDHYSWDRFPSLALLAILLGLWAGALDRDQPVQSAT